jgi:CheY-like chemotaxis protein
LIVDDEPDITVGLKTVLETNGYSYVDTLNDPAEVISRYNQPGIYDLLILDIVMPNMDGFELYDRIRKIDNKVKVCFITAYKLYTEALEEIYSDFELGCFLEKPIENEEFLRKVASAIL